MAACPCSTMCVLHEAVEPSIIKRVKFASVFPYCRGGRHEECALYQRLAQSLPVSRNLMPDGSTGDYLDDPEHARGARRFLIIEDSPVFAALASSVISSHFTGAEIVRKPTYEAAADDLCETQYTAVVCGYGLGDSRTAHDVRQLTNAPMVVLTGRPGRIDAPHGSQVVGKSAGPEALASALRACLG